MNNNLKKLEFDKILSTISSFCKTYIGKSLVNNLRPSQNYEEVHNWLTETSQGVVLIQRNSTPPLSEIADISMYLKTLDGCGTLSIKALLELQNILEMSIKLKDYFFKEFLESSDFSAVESLFKDLYTNPNIVSTFQKSIIDEETIADNASSKLQTIRRDKRKIEQDIRTKLNSILHSSAYSKYIQESLVTIRNGRFVIPVKEEFRNSIKGFVHDMSSSGSTVFIEPIAVFDLNNDLSNLNIEESIEIERILQYLSSLLYPYTKELKNNVEIIGKLDFIFAKAQYSLRLHCSTPILNKAKFINFKNARHPLIDPTTVVPISLELGNDFSSLIITGPNTGGKTVTLKTIGLLSAMACSGLNIPADENSSVYIFDHIYADIGDEQSISESLSTFSSHISNIVKICNTATSNSLILVDELGSGTDPLEGAHLAISILQFFTKLGAITVATSHYQELKQYALITPNFKNASVEFDLDKLKPTYRLLVGIPGKSNAFEISKKLGLNPEIILQASSMIDKKTIHLEDLLKSIYDDKSKIEQEKLLTSKTLAEVEELKRNLNSQKSDVLNIEKKLIENAKQEAKQILLDAKETANSIIKEINLTNSASEANKLRNKLNKELESLRNINSKYDGFEGNDWYDGSNGHEGSAEYEGNANFNKLEKSEIKPGLTVFVSSVNSEGTILSGISKDNTVQVQVGFIKMNVDIKELKKSNNNMNNKEMNINNKNVNNCSSFNATSTNSSFKIKNISPEINIIGMTVDEAIPIIDKYLDDCYRVKLTPIRIIHGKGTGALRNGVHKYLKTNKIVTSFRLGTFGEGEMGITIVDLL